MNKLFLGLLLFSFHLQAKGAEEAVIVMEAHNHRGVLVHRELVLIENGVVMVNGEKLNPTEIITQSGAIKKISRFLADDNSKCEMGFFKHLYKKGKILKVERGCLNNDRYNELLAAFSALKKDKITQ